MKKLISLLLVVAMIAAMAVGCANSGSKGDVPASALEILEKVWALYGEDEKFFAMGGDMNNMVDGAPGKYDVADENLPFSLLVPADQVTNIDQAASLIHAMNANTFTCSAVHVKGVKAADFVKTMQDAVQGNQWMCGFPDNLVIAVVGGEYVVTAFGASDLMTVFKTHLTAAYPNAELLVDEAVAI